MEPGHPHGRPKSKHWVVNRYFGSFHPTRRDRWVFGNRDNGGYLLRFGWTKIIRHDLVKGTSSPDDPALTSYWTARRRKAGPGPPVDHGRMRQLQAQHGRCAACGGLLLDADRPLTSPQEWEQWLTVTRKAITHQAITEAGTGPPDDHGMLLIHTYCRRRTVTGSSYASTCHWTCLSPVR